MIAISISGSVMPSSSRRRASITGSWHAVAVAQLLVLGGSVSRGRAGPSAAVLS